MDLPQTLGRLQQVRQLGVGGFATVWLYRDPDLDSLVAVKALNPGWAADTAIKDRFLQEARFLRSVDSQHVVRVHDIGTTDAGVPYFVMTYASKGTVADLLRERRRGLRISEVAAIISQSAAGVAALHARNVIHRDLKPANLLLAESHDGLRVVIADLGIARSLDAGSEVTRDIGTPAYMSPEQFDSDIPVDQRTDVRALGAVAWALLAGHSPKPAPALTIRVPSIGTVRPVTAELDAVVDRALEPDPRNRWPDVRSFASALAKAAERAPDESGPALPIDVVAPSQPSAPSHPSQPSQPPYPPQPSYPSPRAPTPPQPQAPPWPQAPGQQGPGQQSPRQYAPSSPYAAPQHVAGAPSAPARQGSGSSNGLIIGLGITAGILALLCVILWVMVAAG